MGKLYYKNVYLYSSLQTSGYLEEYFVNHTENLVVFVLGTRLKNYKNLLRFYKNGNLIKESSFALSTNIFLYYALWFLRHNYFLIRYFSRKEKVYVMSTHPVTLFGMSIQKLLRNIKIFYLNGDYFPPVNLSLFLFEKIKRFYCHKVEYCFYYSDRINEKMNGKILHTPYRKTVMLGILPKNIKRLYPKKRFSILFIGAIKPGQGLEYLFDFLEKHSEYTVKILGTSSDKLYSEYKQIIKKKKIDKQVYFPNRFFSDGELEKISKNCHVGIALYDADPTNCTYYSDPGKVKTYASLGLPIIMTDVSTSAKYIKKFECGILVSQNSEDIVEALVKIKKHYRKYLQGLQKFRKYFNYESYYSKSFKFL